MVRSSVLRVPRPLALAIAALLTLAFTPLVTATEASAADIGGFEIDGDTVHDSAEDWNDLSASEVGTGIDNRDGSGQDASTFKSSSKEFSGGGTWDDWEYQGGNATGKSDFGRFATYAKTVEVGGDDHQFLYFAFDRGFGTGTSLYAFEYNQLTQDTTMDPNPVRSQGDVRIVLHDQGSGLISLTADDAGIYVWDDPDQAAGEVGEDTDKDGDWDEVTSGTASAAANTAPIPAGSLPSWWTSFNITGGQLGIDQFIEVGIDLTSFGATVGCPSEGFNAANSRSITGTGAGALVDYIPWIPIDVPSTCSSIPIEKHVLDADGTRGALLGGATFTITPDPRPDGDPDPNTGSLDVTDDDANDADPTDGKILISPAEPGEYTIVEKTAPAGYIKDGSSEEVTAPDSSPADVTIFDNGLGRVVWDKVDGDDDALAGATFRITATGGAAAAAPWNLDANPIDVTDNQGRDVDGDDGEFRVVDLPTGTYQLVETDAPDGYALDPTVATFTISTLDAVTPADGEFVDPRVTSELRVEKQDAATGAVLAGATFALYVDDNGDPGLQRAGGDPDTQVGTCVTAPSGRCAVDGLDWGQTYYWVELTPPPGYNLPDDVVSDGIEITAESAGGPFAVTVFEDPRSEIETDATSGTALPNASLSDTATLSGVPSNAEGTITFRAYGPVPGVDPAPTCTVPAFTSDPVPVSGPGEYTSNTFNPTQAGTYFWIASYSGDVAHQVQPVAGECGDANETSVVAPATPGITTQATERAQLPGAAIADTATVSPVTPDATGTITFTVYGPDDVDCSGEPAATYADQATTVVPAPGGGHYLTATSPTFDPTQAGAYRWIAEYSGDANNAAVAGECNDPFETSTVDKAEPTISTLATAADTLPDASISDTATVTGLTGDATGTVTFDLFGPNDLDCSGDVVFTSTVPLGTVTGGVASPSSAAYAPTAAGAYQWIASYSGDGNNEAVSGMCGDEGETSVIGKAQPSIETLATDTTTLPDASISDTATVSGLTANATGTVTFAAYGPDDVDCAGDAVFTSTVALGAVTGGVASPISGAFSPADAGTYLWIASYSGDGDNEAVSGACGDEGETSVVNKAQPEIATQATASSTLPDASISDTATVSGLTADAAGTVTFDVYGPDDADCSDDAVFTSTVPLGAVTGGVASPISGSFSPADAGTYLWIASYSGDGDNEAVSGECGDEGETSVVNKAQPDIATQATASSALPDASIGDTATITGLSSPAGGDVTFDVYGPDDADCSGDAVFTSTVAISDNGDGTASATSAAFEPSDAGTYLWIATYAGDDNNMSVAGTCGDEGETSVVNKARPEISTQATPTTDLPEGTIKDTATLTGLTEDAQGTVTFDVYGPNDLDCGGEPVFTDTVDVSGVESGVAVVDSAEYTPTKAGTYLWIAAYSGDPNNEPVAGECGDENEDSEVGRTNPEISTQATESTTLPDASINDTATLTGLTDDATGDVIFDVYGPDDADCSGEPVFSSMVPLVSNGDGTGVATSASYVPTDAGTYLWIATYSGDENNAPEAGECGDEGETSIVAPAVTTIVTQATPTAVINDGDTISDTATVSGVTADAAGTVTFDLYAAGDTDCSGEVVFTSTVAAVPGDGVLTATSAAYTPTAPGTYQWIASYSGDANNAPSAGECGDEGETSVVLQGQVPGLEKVADPASGTPVAAGQRIAYTVTARNTGDVAIEDGVVTDVLPRSVTADPATISNGGVLSADGATITWTLDFGIPGQQEGSPSEYALTYEVTVDADVPSGTDLVNTARFFDLQATTTHPVATVVVVDDPDTANPPPPEVVTTGTPPGLAVTGLLLRLDRWIQAALLLMIFGTALAVVTRRRRAVRPNE